MICIFNSMCRSRKKTTYSINLTSGNSRYRDIGDCPAFSVTAILFAKPEYFSVIKNTQVEARLKQRDKDLAKADLK